MEQTLFKFYNYWQDQNPPPPPPLPQRTSQRKLTTYLQSCLNYLPIQLQMVVSAIAPKRLQAKLEQVVNGQCTKKKVKVDEKKKEKKIIINKTNNKLEKELKKVWNQCILTVPWCLVDHFPMSTGLEYSFHCVYLEDRGLNIKVQCGQQGSQMTGFSIIFSGTSHLELRLWVQARRLRKSARGGKDL